MVGIAGTGQSGGGSAGSGNAGMHQGGKATGGGAGMGGSAGSAGMAVTGGSGGSLAGAAGQAGANTAGAGGGFACPPGSETRMPTLPANAGSPIANVPPAGDNSANLEGPVWIDGWLYLSEIGRPMNDAEPDPGRIIRYRPGGNAEVFLPDVGTNGLAVNAAGDLVAASHKLGAIVSFALGGTPSATPKQTFASMYMGTRFSSPNDLTIRRDGNIYFTDPNYQSGSVRQSAERAYRVSPTGEISVIEGAPTPPNGILLSKDQNTLYIGGGSLKKYAVMPDGSISGSGTDIPNFYGGIDGLGMDCAGNVYVTLHGEGLVAVLNASTGERMSQSIMVGNGVTNVAFGGPDNETLFITKLNPPSLYAVDVGVPGYPY
jgi:gluconolactonase